MPKRVPVTTFMTTERIPMFSVAALCGQSWAGMVLTNDMAVQMRRALSHAEDCEECEQRWRVLTTPGTIVGITPGTIVGIGEPQALEVSGVFNPPWEMAPPDAYRWVANRQWELRCVDDDPDRYELVNQLAGAVHPLTSTDLYSAFTEAWILMRAIADAEKFGG